MPDTNPKRAADGSFDYKKGKWWPLWAIFMIPFLLIFKPLYKYVKDAVNWKAAWATVLLCEVVLMTAEWYSLKRGHWVYNEARILGPKVFGVPIEEPLLYYLFSPLIIISLMESIRKKLSSK